MFHLKTCGLSGCFKNEVYLALARVEAPGVVLLDQSAAFDIIYHDTLLDCVSSWFGVGWCSSGLVLVLSL